MNYFKVAGYFENDFKEKDIDYKLFSEAYSSGIEISNSYDALGGDAYFNTFQPQFNYIRINISKILKSCEEYLKSINTGKLNFSDAPNHKMYEIEGSIYGIPVFDCLVKEIDENLKNNKQLDYRKFHLIFEHELIMRKRILYLSNKFPNISTYLLIKKYMN